MKDVEHAKQRLQELLRSQRLAVLSTHQHNSPYASLVGFVATDDAKYLLFATPRSTRKYANLCQNDRVAMLIDSRSDRDADFHVAAAATAIGTAQEVPEHDREAMLALFPVNPYFFSVMPIINLASKNTRKAFNIWMMRLTR